ncbi:N-acetyltransferase [Vibrio sp.]|nr:N-acetyltransferase [Vibrio sp.]
MNYLHYTKSLINQYNHQDIIHLFQSTFTQSEGEDAGKTIGKLVTDIIEQTPESDHCIYLAEKEDVLTGAIILSAMTINENVNTNAKVYLLSPVAVKTDSQGQGIGQALIQFGFEQIKALGATHVMTYGDPAFYGKVGFEPVTEAQFKAPQALSFPHGWIGRSLVGDDFDLMVTGSGCISALNHAEYW